MPRLALLLVVAATLAAAGGPLAGPAGATTFRVTTTADAGPGSLRQALADANATSLTDTIAFAIGGTGLHTMILTSGALPAITSPVVIDGRTQPGYAGTPLVRLHNGTGTAITGLSVTAGVSQVRGLMLTGFRTAIRLDGGDGNTVAANWVGLTTSTKAVRNTTGISIVSGSAANTIGGTTSGARNIISGNTTGVFISGPGATSNAVSANYIGTNPTAGAALGNTVGVRIAAGATGNTIGGAARNVISGNAGTGVRLEGAGTSGNRVEGNRIGTDPAGGTAIPNLTGLVVNAGASDNTIGGTASAARNLISGNTGSGVHLEGPGTTRNAVVGNYVGVDAAGTGRLSNHHGVFVYQAPGNTIGGRTTGARNLISGNGQCGGTFCNADPGCGVCLWDLGATGNRVEGNYIGTDAGGTAAIPNDRGVQLIHAPGNTVGGSTAGVRNVISGNAETGVGVFQGSTDNIVAGNYIGTSADGTAPLGNGFAGVHVNWESHSNTIGGTTTAARNVIAGNAEAGVAVLGGSTKNTVAGNFIGTDASGTVALRNQGIGAWVRDSRSNTIGGITSSSRNVISGNDDGVVLDGQSFAAVPFGTSANRVQGNRIGTNAAGTAPLRNMQTGVRVVGGAAGNTIGGTTSAARNLISGNGIGVEITGATTRDNRVSANFIGTDSSGTVRLPNASYGVAVRAGAPRTTIGGPRNVISANPAGDLLVDGPSDATTIIGNYIGTNAAGSAALWLPGNGVVVSGGATNTRIGGAGAGEGNLISGHAGAGIVLDRSSGATIAGNAIGTDATLAWAVPNGQGITVRNGANGNTIGGTVDGAGNTVQFNTDGGVVVDGSYGDTIEGNSIHANGGPGIALVAGGNHDQAPPVITSVVTTTATTIQGDINGLPNTPFRVELFSSPGCGQRGVVQGRTFLGYAEATTDASGHATFTKRVRTLAAGQVVTATATNRSTGDTSGFTVPLFDRCF